jgi:HEAT repeat protein
MAKSRKLEELQAQLNQIRAEPAASVPALRQILTSRYAIAIAQAARIIREADLRELLPDLDASFERLMQNPVTTDPNCLGKKAIADALYRLEYTEEKPFLQGIHHAQMEPVWGGQVDTAAGLRGICALGLVRMNYSEVMLELADLLADPELEARVGAMRALTYSESPQAVPLLRLKLRLGDDPTVLSEGFAGLLRLSPTASFELVAGFLHDANLQVQEMAALALGESRLAAALPRLQQWQQQCRHPDLRQTGLLAIAMLRLDEAIEFLLSLIATGNLQDCQAAIAALQIYQDDRDLASRIQQQLSLRRDDNSDST